MTISSPTRIICVFDMPHENIFFFIILDKILIDGGIDRISRSNRKLHSCPSKLNKMMFQLGMMMATWPLPHTLFANFLVLTGKTIVWGAPTLFMLFVTS